MKKGGRKEASSLVLLYFFLELSTVRDNTHPQFALGGLQAVHSGRKSHQSPAPCGEGAKR
jgi:hypothetical protein